MPIINPIRAEAGDGPWFSSEEMWRRRTAEQNIDTHSYRTEDALQVAPVAAAVMVLTKMAASSEWVVERFNSEGRWEKVNDGLPAWADPDRRPNPYQSRMDFLKMISLNLLVYGNAIVVVNTRKGVGNRPSEMLAYPWWNVTVSAGDRKYQGADTGDPKMMSDESMWGVPGYGGSAKEIRYSIDGKTGLKPLSALNPDGEVLHIKYATMKQVLFGQSPLLWAAQAVRTALAADAFAELNFLHGMFPYGLLAHKAGKPGDALINSFREYLQEVARDPRKKGPFVTSGEWNYQRFGVTPDELQLLPARKMGFSIASALLGVAPELIGHPDARASGSGMRYAQQALARLHGRDHNMMISEPMSETLETGMRARLVPTGLAEMDPLEDSRINDRLIRVGVLKPNEVREKMGLTPIPGLDEEVCPQVVGTGGGGPDAEPGPDSGATEESPTTPGGEM